MNDTPETDNERTLKLALEVFTELANTLKQERDEARELLANALVRGDLALEETKKAQDALSWSDIQDKREMQRERDKAREEIENLKLQLGLWEDGNLICEETLGEIRLLEEQLKNTLLERNEAREQAQRLRVENNHNWQAHKIAERAIDDLAWFNETNARRLRSELDQLKECAK
jgi:hypothetical protein